MTLQFDPSAYGQAYQQGQQNLQADRDARTKAILDSLASINQGVSNYQNYQKQQALLDLASRKENRETQQFNSEYGTPIDPNAMSVSPYAAPQTARSIFMPGGQGQVAQPSPLIDRFNQWRAGGMTSKTAEPDFMGALGKDERKMFYDQNSPQMQAEIELRQAQAAKARAEAANPNADETYTVIGTDRNGNAIQIGNKSGKPRIIPIPGGGQIYPKNTPEMTPEASGRLNMLNQAVTEIEGLQNKLFDKNGKLNRTLIAEANTPFGGLPFSEGRTINSMFENAINAKLRAETGAQANPSEIQNIARRFRISVVDSDATAQDKLNRFMTYLKTSIQSADPRGFRSGGPGSNGGNNDPLDIR